MAEKVIMAKVPNHTSIGDIEFTDIKFIRTQSAVAPLDSADVRFLELLEQSFDTPYFPEKKIDFPDTSLEECRQLKSKLEIFRKKGLKSILIQSILKGEGSSTILYQLSKGLVQKKPEKVLAIDCNFENPTLHTFFHVNNENGLVEMMRRKVGIERAIRQTPFTNLYVLPAGDVGSEPARIQDYPFFEEILRILELEFDYIFLDCAALHQSDAGYFLAQKVNGVILVMQAHRSRIKFAEKVKQNLVDQGALVLGVVFNQRKSSWLSRIF